MAKQLGFCIEQNMCMGCKACQVACKDKYDLNVGVLFRRVTETEGGKFIKEGHVLKNNVYSYWTSLACNHCEKPVCVYVCPTNAMYKRKKDGIVLVNKEKCIGCGACAKVCPYDIPIVDKNKEKAIKCDFCVDLIVEGKDPACVASCPVRALHYGDIEDLRKKYGYLDTIAGMPKPETRPSLVIVPHKDVIL